MIPQTLSGRTGAFAVRLTRPGAARGCALALLAAVALSGCEAPLKLEDVDVARQQSVRRMDLYQAAAENTGNVVVVMGYHGLVLTSSDDGANWSRQELPGWPSLIDVVACPNGMFAALAVEGQVWTSTDGTAWTPNPIETEEAAQALTCDGQNRIWVVGSYSTILVSGDAGKTWEDKSVGEDFILTSIQFVDDQNGIILGEFGNIMRSSDGGETWELGDPMPEEFYPQDALFKDVNTGWVSGLGGRILRTTDGGVTWEIDQTPTLAPIYSLAFVGDTLYAVGGSGVLLRQEAGEWKQVDHGKSILLHLRAMLPVAGDRLLVGGAAGALYVLPVTTLPAVSGAHAEG